MAQYHLRYVDSTACYLIRMGNAVSDSHPALPRSRRKKHLILCSCRCARRRTSADSYTLVPCSWRYVCRLCHSYHAQKCKGSKRIHHPGLGTFSFNCCILICTYLYQSASEIRYTDWGKYSAYYRRPDCSSFSSWYACLFDYFMGKANRNPLGHVSGNRIGNCSSDFIYLYFQTSFRR